MPSAAVARTTAVPASSAVSTPLASMLATAGVSDDQVMVVATVVLPSRSVAKIWSWKPAGSAASDGRRPEKVSVRVTGVLPLPLQAPTLAAFGPLHAPVLSRCSDWPAAGDGSSLTPMSVDVIPAAGPLVAANVPSYERNSTTAPLASTSASPSGSGVVVPPFWRPLLGYVLAITPRVPQVAGIVPDSVHSP